VPQQPLLEGLILEKPPPGSGVNHAQPHLVQRQEPEPLPNGLSAPAHDHHRARAHVLLLTDDSLDAALGKVRERFLGALQIRLKMPNAPKR
jgi:hypothetical protein